MIGLATKLLMAMNDDDVTDNVDDNDDDGDDDDTNYDDADHDE